MFLLTFIARSFIFHEIDLLMLGIVKCGRSQDTKETAEETLDAIIKTQDA